MKHKLVRYGTKTDHRSKCSCGYEGPALVEHIVSLRGK